MKKYVVSVLAIVAAFTVTSFETKKIQANSANEKFAGNKWYDFNGQSTLDMCDPSQYSLDDNNFPDCAPASGNIYCEIFAKPSSEVEGEPDLSTIVNQRMRSLN
jgi:hypothetical protein